MDKSNLQPGEEVFQDAEGDVAPPDRYGSGSGDDQEPDSSLQRMTTDAPKEPDGEDPE